MHSVKSSYTLPYISKGLLVYISLDFAMVLRFALRALRTARQLQQQKQRQQQEQQQRQ